jgi:hypothetical protein
LSGNTAEGRPLRVVLLLGMGLGVWVMLRLPMLERDLETTRRGLAGESGGPEASAASPLTLASVTTAQDSGDAVAIAEAEVDVAAAELALAQARLRLVRVRRGDAGVLRPEMAPPRHAQAAEPPRFAYSVPAPAPRQVAAAGGFVPDYGYALPKPARGVKRTAATTAPSPLPVAPGKPEDAGHALATAAYARLQAGDKRGAAELFDAALATPADSSNEQQRALWAAERRRLGKRWRGEIYSLFRDGGQVGPTASPVLGGGQTGINIGWTYDPLARRPVTAIARFNTASAGPGSPDSRTSQAAFGVQWQPVKGVTVAAERLVRIGEFARNDWNLRVAGGGDGRVGRIEWNGYGEAGVLGSGDLYGGAQLRGGVPVFHLQKATLVAGAGAWGGVQTVRFRDGSFALGRVDLGPTLVLRVPLARTSLELSADWRFRVAGGAFPGSGPAVTLSTGF